jgi:outer membrane biosynthesis protein TonB
MTPYAPSLMMPSQSRLWLVSFLCSLALLLIGVFLFGVLTLTSMVFSPKPPLPRPAEQVVVILAPALPKAAPAATTAPTIPVEEKDRPQFARTSADQESAPPEKADFIGDRDTIATSESIPLAGAPAMPSQAGREPLRPKEIETTVSKPQDGDITHTAPSTPSPQPMTQPSPRSPNESFQQELPTKASTLAENRTEQEMPDKPEQKEIIPKETILGEIPVERAAKQEEIKPKPMVATEDSREKASQLPKPNKPREADPTTPGFRGNQEKTKISGSITRQGKSALNVANTSLGRYHAALSRAIEAEWHRNCTKYRDFITPGILTMRFVIDPNGSVRSVSVVEMVDAGEVQKGFTLNSIRQAKLPAIPADLKKELDGEPLEITYNFYF